LNLYYISLAILIQGSMKSIGAFASWLTTGNSSPTPNPENGLLLTEAEARLSQAKNGLLEVLEPRGFGNNHGPCRKSHWSIYFEWYLTYLDQKLHSLDHRLKAALAASDDTSESQASEVAVRFYEILAIVATALTTSFKSPSMEDIRSSLPPHLAAKNDDHTEALLQLIFIAMGLLTMLYNPELSPAPHTVSIAKPLTLSETTLSTDSITNHECSLEDASQLQAHQLLNSFGRLIPGSLAWASEVSAIQQPDIFTEQLVLSYLNFHILFKIGTIKVELVDSLGLHLEFEEKTKTLKLFRFPSYCGLICSETVEESSANTSQRSSYLSR